MGISSDVDITRDEAMKRVKRKLLYEQEKLIDLAIKGMSNGELTSELNKDGSIYYYNIVKGKK
jgi:hypothetical protein